MGLTGQSPRAAWMSVWHRPLASILTRTWPSPGVGVSTSLISSGAPRLGTTAALMTALLGWDVTHPIARAPTADRPKRPARRGQTPLLPTAGRRANMPHARGRGRFGSTRAIGCTAAARSAPPRSRTAQPVRAKPSAIESSGTSAPPPTAGEWPRCCRPCWRTAGVPGSRTAGSSSTVIADFFTITKRIHNMLHGSPGDGGGLGACGARPLRGGAEPEPRRHVHSGVPGRPRAAARPTDGRAGGAPSQPRSARRVALPRRSRHPEPALDRRPGTSCGRSWRRGAVRVLAPGLRARLGRPGQAAGDPTLDRPVLDQEPSSSRTTRWRRSWPPWAW